MNAAVDEEPVDPSDELMFLCLGGGNEVGRSCHVVQYKGKTVMVSCNLKNLNMMPLLMPNHSWTLANTQLMKVWRVCLFMTTSI